MDRTIKWFGLLLIAIAAILIIFPLASTQVSEIITEYEIKKLLSKDEKGLQDTKNVDKNRYLSIPAMNISLKVFNGATEENLAKGAAFYTDDSGYTNLVIAAHRGYHGMPFFRDIENLSIGDEVKLITGKKEKRYEVFDIDIIACDDSEALHRYTKKTLTLFTCHPYGGDGRYRYVVYCALAEKSGAGKGEKEQNSDVLNKELIIKKKIADTYGSSKNRIIIEKLFRLAAVLMLIAMYLYVLRRRKNREKDL